MERRFSTAHMLSDKQADSLLSRLIYSLEGIRDCRLDNETQEIVVELIDPSRDQVLEDTVTKLIELEKKNRAISHRIIKDNREKHAVSRELTALTEVDSVYALDGSVSKEAAVRLFDEVDALFMKLACNHQAALRKYPSMIPVRTLEKCSYIKSFPQNIHLVAEFPHQLDQLEKVRETENVESIARLSPYALSPAVCFHCYEELSGQQVDAPLILTAKGSCFRHEAPWRLGKHRLNEFAMREIVLIGEEPFVEAERRAFIEEVWQLFVNLGFTGRIETASDPFYFSEENSKSQHQLMANTKYELIVDIYNGQESFSIASFNNVGNTLCKPFGITDKQSVPLHSGCIAFGIDRWVYALLALHGTHVTLS
jgi:seryl-tRNA synthetase